MTNQEINQGLLMKFQILEKQMQQLQEQIQAVEQGSVELQTLSFGLDDLKNKTGEEIFAPVGKGIFIKAKLASEELLVDIGNQNFVTKNLEEAKELIQLQVKKLETVRSELENAMEKLGEEVEKTMSEYSKEQEENGK